VKCCAFVSPGKPQANAVADGTGARQWAIDRERRCPNAMPESSEAPQNQPVSLYLRNPYAIT
jgi:hypothetical protein